MISFVIPTKNEEKVLDNTLSGLIKYSGDAEIIISDGNSTDQTLAIAQKYTDKITVYTGAVRQKIGGGRNAGALLAKGNYLVFLDADVTIPDSDHFFATARGIFEKNKNLVGLTAYIRVVPELETLSDKIIFSILNYFNVLVNNILHTGGAPGEFQMIRIDAFKKVGGFDETIAASEDYELFRRLSKIGATRVARNLTVYHTGRRAHTIGWPKLLTIWLTNGITVLFFRKAASKEWREVR